VRAIFSPLECLARLRCLCPVLAYGALALVVSSLLMAFAAPARAIEVGQLAPDFTLYDLDGSAHRLRAESGHIVVLFFFGVNGTACVNAARELDGAVYQAYQASGVQVWGIDAWNAREGDLIRFASECNVSYPLLAGGRTVAETYDLPYHSFVIIGMDGVVRYVSEGPGDSALDSAAMVRTIRQIIEDSNVVRENTWGEIKTLFERDLVASR